jgi:outer membrane receptor for ferrienterochelin and colicin
MLDDTWTTGKSDMKTIAAAVLMMMVAGVLPASGQQGRPGAVPVPMAEAAPSAGEGVSGSEAAVRPGGRPGGAQRGDVTASVLLGSLLDGTTGQPLQSATVEVRSAADSSLVAGALTSAEGRFRVAGLEPGVYYVRATMIGYAPAIVDDIAMAAGATRQLEPVRLGVSAVMLQGLEVAVERAAVRMEVDRTVFSARNLPSAAGGSATDVLRNVPSVDVDGDGQVSVRGSTNVVIQINGRTAPFRGDALNLFLRQLPAGTIDRIEVLPNPAARYDPEGMSGIVNIVLRQDANLGLSAGITAAASSADRFNGSGTVGYQRGRTTLAGMYSLNSDVRRPTAFMQRLNRFGAGETVVQDTRNRQESLGQSLMASIDYQVRPTTTLSLQASGNVNGSDGLALSDYRLLDAALAPGRSWNSGTGTERDLRAGDVTLGMRRVMAAGRNETSFEARLSGSGDESEALYGDADLASIRDLRRNETTNRDASLQFDATRLLAGIRVESGARAEQRLIDTDLTLRRSAGAPVDASRSNAFEYESRIYAGYTQLSRAFGPLSVQAGARLEHADTRFDLRTLEEAYDNRYTSLYPSASALYDMGSGRSVRAGFSRRVQRPRTRQLNPFPLQEDSLSLLVGNPSLLPQYTSSFDVTLQATGALGTLQLAPFYRRSTDMIRHYKTIDPATGVSLTTFRNFDRSSQFGTDITATGRLGSRVSGMLGGSMAQVTTSGESLQEGLGSSALSWSVRSNATLRLGTNTDAQGFLMYRAPMKIEQGRMREFVVSNVSLRQRVMEGRGEVVLRVSDPLGRMNFGFFTSDDLHEQEFLRRSDSRAAVLSFNYSFGRPPRMRQRAAEEMEMEIR